MTRDMERMLSLAMIFGIILFLLVVFPATGGDVTTVPYHQCEEDEPCWDCETMGNRICGKDHNNDD